MYRGVNTARIAVQQTDAFRYAGQTATWRQYISASAVTSSARYAGFSDAPRYQERTITALFGRVEQNEQQQAAGMMAAADIFAVTREPIGRQDEITWQGTTYRVEGVPVPARIAGTWTVMLKRANP